MIHFYRNTKNERLKTCEEELPVVLRHNLSLVDKKIGWEKRVGRPAQKTDLKQNKEIR